MRTNAEKNAAKCRLCTIFHGRIALRCGRSPCGRGALRTWSIFPALNIMLNIILYFSIHCFLLTCYCWCIYIVLLLYWMLNTRLCCPPWPLAWIYWITESFRIQSVCIIKKCNRFKICPDWRIQKVSKSEYTICIILIPFLAGLQQVLIPR